MNTFTEQDHLTHEQISNLLIADPTICDLDLPQTELDSEAHIVAHLRACEVCSGELMSLRQSLVGFREATTLYSANAPQRRLVPVRRFTATFALWTATAAAVLVAGVLMPLNLHKAHPVATPVQTVAGNAASAQNAVSAKPTTQSDEELIAGIEQDLSASIPSSMQPLEDPIPSSTNSTQASK